MAIFNKKFCLYICKGNLKKKKTGKNIQGKLLGENKKIESSIIITLFGC